jgi:gp16 family phage-associated protein
MFRLQGISVAEFARSEGFDTHLVYQVIYGRVKGNRGQSHNIAIALGLKNGTRTDKPATPHKKQRDAACLTA